MVCEDPLGFGGLVPVKLNDLISTISSRLNDKHIENLKKIVEISKRFHKMAKIPVRNVDISEESVVLESGHQPNFFPYSGVWRKVFLLDYISERLTEIGREVVPVFGLFDFNLCTARLLFQNRVPAVNKDGFVTIGLRKPSGLNIWRRFNSIEKPTEEDWEKVVNRIKDIYRNASREILEVIIEEMWKSYELGKTLSDVNAILFSRLCSLFGFDVLFFRYSDVQRCGLFVEEWRRIVSRLKEFNRIYNEIVMRRGLENDLGLVEENMAPFWYHCECGAKVQMYHDGEFFGICPICKREHGIASFEDEFKDISPRAVPRNLIFSEGMGTSLFISGAGGGLKYGMVADEIAGRFGFNRPITLVWVGRDYYLGLAHRQMLKEMMRLFDMKFDDLLDRNVALSKVRDKRKSLARMVNSSDDRLRQRYIGQYIYSETQLKIAGSMFSITPSILDILMTFGFERVANAWKDALNGIDVMGGEFYKIEADIHYEDNVSKIYDVVRILSDKSKEIDPLGLLGGG